jgi:hypothetical protein
LDIQQNQFKDIDKDDKNIENNKNLNNESKEEIIPDWLKS